MGILSAQSPPYIPAFGAPALSQLLRSKERARTLQAELTPTSSSFCPHFTNSFYEQMKRLRPKKKDRPAEEKRHSPAGRKISVRTQGNFCAHKKIFSCARKFFALRKEANFLPQSDSFPCGKSSHFEQKKLPLPLEERPFFCRGGQKRKAPRLTVSALDKELVRREIPSDEAGCEGASPCGKERRS